MTKDKNIHDGHRKRLIETVSKVGLENLSEIQVLEYILFFIFPRGDVNPLAHRLLDRFHRISTVLEANIEDLKMVDGMGETSARKLHSLIDIFEYYYKDIEKDKKITQRSEIYDHFETVLRFRSDEEVYIMGINPKGVAVRERRLAVGNFETVKIDIKDVALYISTYKVNRVVIAHNHPKGSCFPSSDDKNTTARLRNLFQATGCELEDSIIIGSDGIYSICSNTAIRYYGGDPISSDQELNQSYKKKGII